MTDLLLTILVVGSAVTYMLEAFKFALGGFFEPTFINVILSLPLSLGGMFAMQRQWSVQMLATVPAATLVALVLIKFINKPTQVEMRRVPRI